MAFTYDPDGESFPSNLERVRMNIGDISDDGDASLRDSEITTLLSDVSDNVPSASVRACELLIARLRRYVDRQHAGQNANLSEKFDFAERTLIVLRRRAGMGKITPRAGQIEKDRNEAARLDTNYEPPSFTVGQDDYGNSDPWADERYGGT